MDDVGECQCRRANGRWRPTRKWCPRHLTETPMCARCYQVSDDTTFRTCRRCGVSHRVCAGCFRPRLEPRCQGCTLLFSLETCGTCPPMVSVAMCSDCDAGVVRCSDACMRASHQHHACWHAGCPRRQCAAAASRRSCEVCLSVHYCAEHSRTDLAQCLVCRRRCCSGCMPGDTCSDACAWRFKCAVFAIAMRDRLPWSVLQRLAATD
jgi:hypothetical protein